MSKILVTGAAGNIGSELTKYLLTKNYYVTGFDNLSSGEKSNLPECDNQFSFIEGDVNNINHLQNVMEASKFEYVFHLAATVGVKKTTNFPLQVLEDIKGIENVLQLSCKTKVKRIFYASSSEIYGEPVEMPLHEETTPLNSKVPYAVVKNICECYVKAYKKEFNLDYTIFRIFNTYGLNQSRDFVIPRFINLAVNNEDILIYGDGSQTRTFLHVMDNVQSMIGCLEKNLYINDTLNIGSEDQITILDLAKLIINLTNSKSKIKFTKPLDVGDMSRRQPDITKLRKIKPDFIELNEGLIYLIKYYNRKLS